MEVSDIRRWTQKLPNLIRFFLDLGLKASRRRDLRGSLPPIDSREPCVSIERAIGDNRPRKFPPSVVDTSPDGRATKTEGSRVEAFSGAAAVIGISFAALDRLPATENTPITSNNKPPGNYRDDLPPCINYRRADKFLAGASKLVCKIRSPRFLAKIEGTSGVT